MVNIIFSGKSLSNKFGLLNLNMSAVYLDHIKFLSCTTISEFLWKLTFRSYKQRLEHRKNFGVQSFNKIQCEKEEWKDRNTDGGTSLTNCSYLNVSWRIFNVQLLGCLSSSSNNNPASCFSFSVLENFLLLL